MSHDVNTALSISPTSQENNFMILNERVLGKTSTLSSFKGKIDVKL